MKKFSYQPVTAEEFNNEKYRNDLKRKRKMEEKRSKKVHTEKSNKKRLIQELNLSELEGGY